MFGSAPILYVLLVVLANEGFHRVVHQVRKENQTQRNARAATQHKSKVSAVLPFLCCLCATGMLLLGPQGGASGAKGTRSHSKQSESLHPVPAPCCCTCSQTKASVYDALGEEKQSRTGLPLPISPVSHPPIPPSQVTRKPGEVILKDHLDSFLILMASLICAIFLVLATTGLLFSNPTRNVSARLRGG